MKFKRLGATVALSTAVVLGMASCATNEETSSDNSRATATNLSGELGGQGASSMEAAQVQWIADFQKRNPGVTVNYAPEGSSAGRKDFIAGGVDFAGSDRPLKDDEMNKGSFKKCTPESSALNLPIYVSPIAIIYNLDGVDDLNLDAPTLAAIFKGQITKWDDPKIKALNPEAKLPGDTITSVHRSDGSGTTENLTDWMKRNAPDVWDADVSGDWPFKSGEAAKGTPGVVGLVKQTKNTIGYADESQAKGMQIAKLKGGSSDEFLKPSAEAAAKVVEDSPKMDGRGAHDWALKLDRTAADYRLILVSYAIVCEDYQDDKSAELVKGYLSYIASDDGQKAAQKSAGSAPLSAKMQQNLKAAIDSIK